MWLSKSEAVCLPSEPWEKLIITGAFIWQLSKLKSSTNLLCQLFNVPNPYLIKEHQWETKTLDECQLKHSDKKRQSGIILLRVRHDVTGKNRLVSSINTLSFQKEIFHFTYSFSNRLHLAGALRYEPDLFLTQVNISNNRLQIHSHSCFQAWSISKSFASCAPTIGR